MSVKDFSKGTLEYYKDQWISYCPFEICRIQLNTDELKGRETLSQGKFPPEKK